MSFQSELGKPLAGLVFTLQSCGKPEAFGKQPVAVLFSTKSLWKAWFFTGFFARPKVKGYQQGQGHSL